MPQQGVGKLNCRVEPSQPGIVAASSLASLMAKLSMKPLSIAAAMAEPAPRLTMVVLAESSGREAGKARQRGALSARRVQLTAEVKRNIL